MSIPVACFTCGAKAHTTMPPPQARSSTVSSGPGVAASTIMRSALASVIGLAVLNGVACRVNWSRIRSWCVLWLMLVSSQPINALRGIVEQRPLLRRRRTGGNALEGIPQSDPADSHLLHRKIALEHASIRAKQLDA